MTVSGRVDIVLVGTIAAGLPLFDYFVGWPAFVRQVERGIKTARLSAYAITAAWNLVLGAAVIGVWRGAATLGTLGLAAPRGWRLWVGATSVALLGVAYGRFALRMVRDAGARGRAEKSLAAVERLLPHTRAEYAAFIALALVAGSGEELLYRGYLIQVLTSWLGSALAVLLSAITFGLAHAYQGRAGMLRSAIIGLVMSGVVALTRSLFPAMALHVVADLGGGTVGWLILRGAGTTKPTPATD